MSRRSVSADAGARSLKIRRLPRSCRIHARRRPPQARNTSALTIAAQGSQRSASATAAPATSSHVAASAKRFLTGVGLPNEGTFFPGGRCSYGPAPRAVGRAGEPRARRVGRAGVHEVPVPEPSARHDSSHVIRRPAAVALLGRIDHPVRAHQDREITACAPPRSTNARPAPAPAARRSKRSGARSWQESAREGDTRRADRSDQRSIIGVRTRLPSGPSSSMYPNLPGQ